MGQELAPPRTREQLSKGLDLYLGKALPKVREALPRAASADQMIHLLHIAIVQEPLILKCSQISLLKCIIQAAQLGLDLNQATGEVHIIPYLVKKKGEDGKDILEHGKPVKGYEANLIPGYKGFVKLAYKLQRPDGAQKVASFKTGVVLESDRFAYQEGTEQKLIHVPKRSKIPGYIERVEKRTGQWGDYEVREYLPNPQNPFKAVYAVVKMLTKLDEREPDPLISVLWRDDIDRRRNASKSVRSPAWLNWYDEMSRGKAARDVCKYLPMSREISRAVSLEDQAERGTTDVPLDLLAQGSEVEMHELEERYQDPEVQEGPQRELEQPKVDQVAEKLKRRKAGEPKQEIKEAAFDDGDGFRE